MAISRAISVGVDLQPTNASLLQGCANGDQQDWNTLVTRYERLIWAIARKEGLDPEASADVTQHTFTELHRSIGSIQEPERLAHWLMTVCRREVWRRRDGHEPTIELRDDRADLKPDFTDSYAEAATVFEAVQSLGDPCRSLIMGLFFDPTEPDYVTLAQQIGRPVGSVGPLRGRCLQRLRDILTNGEINA